MGDKDVSQAACVGRAWLWWVKKLTHGRNIDPTPGGFSRKIVCRVPSEDYPDNNDSTRDRWLECCPDSWEALVIGDLCKILVSNVCRCICVFQVAIETVIELPIWFSKCVQRWGEDQRQNGFTTRTSAHCQICFAQAVPVHYSTTLFSVIDCHARSPCAWKLPHLRMDWLTIISCCNRKL